MTEEMAKKLAILANEYDFKSPVTFKAFLKQLGLKIEDDQHIGSEYEQNIKDTITNWASRILPQKINDGDSNLKTTRIYSIDEAWSLEPQERLNIFLAFNNMNSKYVHGILNLSSNKQRTCLDAYSLQCERLKYPLKINSNVKPLFVTNTYSGYNIPCYVKAEIILANIDEQKRIDNPFLIIVDRNTIETQKEIPEEFIIKSVDDKIYINESIIKMIRYEEDEIMSKLAEKKDELNLLEQLANENNIKYRQLKVESEKIEGDIQKEKDTYKILVNKNKLLQKELKEKELHFSKVNEDMTIINSKHLQEEKVLKKLISNIEEKNSELNNIVELKNKFDKEIEIIKSLKNDELDNINCLHSYLIEKGSVYNKLGFITDNQYRELFGYNLINKENENEKKDIVIYESDSPDASNLKEIISSVQSYLYFKKNIRYPRALLEDFFTLLRTNDLIILSGLSGTGKTSLVKSFAYAINAEPHIIAVKPNWTSSEDLLGYYNPLQKAFLSTDFLHAIIQASRDKDRIHLICLDEMNLAKPEYYFADFLSHLEERGKSPEIPLYSEEEAGHVLEEFKMFTKIIMSAIPNDDDLDDVVGKLLTDREIWDKVQALIGGEKESISAQHSKLRRMISGILNIPAKLKIPDNVRFIGTVNMDHTTNNLSPKVIDRAHIIRFNNPLLFNNNQIDKEVNQLNKEQNIIWVKPDFLGKRDEYPEYKPESEDIKKLIFWSENFLAPLGVDIGYRTLRQSLNYINLLHQQLGENKMFIKIAINNILNHKILPRCLFDGNYKIDENKTKNNLFQEFEENVIGYLSENNIENYVVYLAINEIKNMKKTANSNDGYYNYWAQ